jgi:hypothetical protein
VGDRGHRNDQLRVLGSPSARHTKELRTGGHRGGRGVRGPDFVFAKGPRPLIHTWGTKTGLRASRANGPIGNILAAVESVVPRPLALRGWWLVQPPR